MIWLALLGLILIYFGIVLFRESAQGRGRYGNPALGGLACLVLGALMLLDVLWSAITSGRSG